MNLRAALLIMCLTMSLPVIAQGQVLLDEDFQDGVADDFHPDSDIWSITKSGRYTVELDGFEVASWNRAGDSGWTDYVFDLDMRSKVSVNHAVAVRMQDSGDCYVVNLRSRPYHDAVLSKYVSGEYHHLVFQPAKINGEWQHFSVEVLGATISVYMDGRMLFSHTDQTDPFLSGGIALVGFAGGLYMHQELFVDNVFVSADGFKAAVPVETTTWSHLKALYR